MNDTSPAAGVTGGSATVQRLIARMDADKGFAGLGASISTISSLSEDNDGGSREIAAAILRDAALTARLLRLSNSSQRGGRNVSTVDQALVILGLKTVKSVALSLALLNSLGKKPQSDLLHAEIAASYFCGALAAEITRLNAPRFNQQEAQVCGLLQNLGRMMALYYLYEDIERARALQVEENLDESEAVQRTLGLPYEDIGAAIAQHWNLPYVLQQSLEPMALKTPPRSAPPNAVGWHQACTTFASQVTAVLFRHPEARERVGTAAAIEFFRMALHLKEDEAREAIARALEETEALLSGIGFPCSLDHARALLRKSSERALDILSGQDSLTRDSNQMFGKTPIEAIHTLLRQIHEHYRFDRTLLCLAEGAGNLVAIAGVGRNIAQVTPKFRCHGSRPDLFRLVQGKKVDAYVADLYAAHIVKLLPAWYDELIGASACVLLPVLNGDKCLGLIYGDYAEPPEAAPTGFGEGMVKAWRDQIVMALHFGDVK